MRTDGYRPLDLSAQCNTSIAVLGDGAADPLVGDQLFHGLPFRVGEGDRALILFGPGGLSQPLTIGVDSNAYTVIVAHRLLDGQITPGTPVATYTVGLSDGTAHRVAIRERFEIGDLAAWGQQPFLALPDQANSVFERWT